MSEEKQNPNSEIAGFTEDKKLFDSRTILLSAPVDAKLAHVVNSKLIAMAKESDAPITLFINSPGGEIHSGFSIFDMIRFIKPEVYTVVSGLAASMGTVIALAAKKAHRYALPNAKFLIHQPSVSGGIGGSASDIEIHAKDLIETKNKIVEIYAEETGRKIDEIRTALDRDYWMSAEKAKEFGLISKIVRRHSELAP